MCVCLYLFNSKSFHIYLFNAFEINWIGIYSIEFNKVLQNKHELLSFNHLLYEMLLKWIKHNWSMTDYYRALFIFHFRYYYRLCLLLSVSISFFLLYLCFFLWFFSLVHSHSLIFALYLTHTNTHTPNLSLSLSNSRTNSLSFCLNSIVTKFNNIVVTLN